MNFNKFLKSIFGDKSKRDMRLIQPLVEKVKEVSPEIEKLTNDELRAKSKEIQKYVQDAATPFKEKINEDLYYDFDGKTKEIECQIKLIPYCKWGNRGENEMTVYLKLR